MKEHLGPIVLEAEYFEESNCFLVKAIFEGREYSEMFTRPSFEHLCEMADKQLWIEGLAIDYSRYDRRDIGPRARRSFAQYLRSVLGSSRK